MRTVQIDVFTFEELGDKAKEKARQWYRAASVGDTYWSECIIDGAKECGALLGLSIDNVYWSGFASQGDGACIIGRWNAANVNADALKAHAPTDERLHRIAGILASIAKEYPGAWAKIEHRGHYCHSRSVSYEMGCDEDDEREDSFAHDYREALEDAFRAFMDWIYDNLQREYEYQDSDEAIDETIIANEYDFLADGSRFA